MCQLGDNADVETAPRPAPNHQELQHATRTVAHATTQMRMMMVGAAVLTGVLLLFGLILTIVTGGAIADARTGFNAGLAAIVAGMVMVVSWGALRGHATILGVVGHLLTAIAALQAEVARVQDRQDRETAAFNELAVAAADQLAQRRRAGG